MGASRAARRAEILVEAALVVETTLAIAIQPVKRDPFEDRFQNWVRWCVAKGLYQGRAGSAEGAWRSPQIWDPPGPRPAAINDPDAILVNRAYVRLRLTAPKAAAVINMLTFPPSCYWRPQWQAQKLGIHWTRLEEEYDRCKKMLRNQLQYAESKRIM